MVIKSVCVFNDNVREINLGINAEAKCASTPAKTKRSCKPIKINPPSIGSVEHQRIYNIIELKYHNQEARTFWRDGEKRVKYVDEMKQK